MAFSKKKGLSNEQIKFMEYWSSVVLKNKRNITTEMLNKSASFIKFKRSGGCSTCLKNDVLELNNIYNRLLDEYNKHLKDEETLEDLKELNNEIKDLKDDNPYEKTLNELEDETKEEPVEKSKPKRTTRRKTTTKRTTKKK